MRAVLGGLLALATAACHDVDKTAPLARDGAMDWDRARAIARAYHVERGGSPRAVLTRFPRVKYLFRSLSTHILVHRGVVVTGGGWEVLAGYLADLSPSDRTTLQTTDLVALVRTLDALPPITRRDPLAYRDDPADPGILPRLDWTGNTGSFHLYYDITRNRGAIADPEIGTYARWTLTIDPIGAVPWSEVTVRYHVGTDQFVP